MSRKTKAARRFNISKLQHKDNIKVTRNNHTSMNMNKTISSHSNSIDGSWNMDCVGIEEQTIDYARLLSGQHALTHLHINLFHHFPDVIVVRSSICLIGTDSEIRAPYRHIYTLNVMVTSPGVARGVWGCHHGSPKRTAASSLLLPTFIGHYYVFMILYLYPENYSRVLHAYKCSILAGLP